MTRALLTQRQLPSRAAAPTPASTPRRQRQTRRRFFSINASSSSGDATPAAPSSAAVQKPLQQQPPPPQQQPPPDTGDRDRSDLVKAVGVGALVSVVAGILDHDAVEDHQSLAMAAVFCLGYAGIIAEDLIGFNKAGVALGTAVSLWVIRATGAGGGGEAELSAALGSVSELIYFLVGAMTIVEVVDAHGGFKPLAAAIGAGDAPPSSRNSRLLWGTSLLAFALSSALDNLTTTIVMLSVLQRAVPGDKELRRLLGAAVVIAANAGGAWSPIGDLTSTMLWVNGRLTTLPMMRDLVLPSLVSTLVPLALLQATAPEFRAGGGGSASSSSSSGSGSSEAASGDQPAAAAAAAAAGPAVAAATAAPAAAAALPDLSLALVSGSSLASVDAPQDAAAAAAAMEERIAFEDASQRGPLVLAVGLLSLLSVPLFKHFTGLPPFLGVLCGLSVLWLLTDALHFGESRALPRVSDALRKIDIEATMFFLGILLAVSALDAAGILEGVAVRLSEAVPNAGVIAGAIGLVSSLVDNVPLVAATMGMYDVAAVPPDSQLWQLIALCAGTGGSLLVIGSAAGVAFMSIEGASFSWFLRRVTPAAFAGYAAAFGTYALLHGLPTGSVA